MQLEEYRRTIYLRNWPAQDNDLKKRRKTTEFLCLNQPKKIFSEWRGGRIEKKTQRFIGVPSSVILATQHTVLGRGSSPAGRFSKAEPWKKIGFPTSMHFRNGNRG